jgi:hydroxymethylglutaryl-CoA lyase
MEKIKIIECPRDAMQGIKSLIPGTRKAAYMQSLLRVGFDTLDFGSFVSPKAIPQMQDTAEVLSMLDLSATNTKLLAIIANTQGAQTAAQHEAIRYLGFPFSISENFQMRNTHKTIAESLVTLSEILEIADVHHKEVVAYLSMGFGNPYGDPWNVEIVGEWTEKLSSMGVKILSLSDTVGSSTPDVINYLFTNLIPRYPQIEFGAHLHTTPDRWFEKVEAADKLTGNMPTERLLSYFTANKADTGISPMSFESAYNEATKLFGEFH